MALADLNIGEITRPKSTPFARQGGTGIPDDHPIVKAFRMSWQNGEPLEIETTTPKEVVSFLRRIARKDGLGLRTQQFDDAVVFQARELRTRKNGDTANEETDE